MSDVVDLERLECDRDDAAVGRLDLDAGERRQAGGVARERKGDCEAPKRDAVVLVRELVGPLDTELARVRRAGLDEEGLESGRELALQDRSNGFRGRKTVGTGSRRPVGLGERDAAEERARGHTPVTRVAESRREALAGDAERQGAAEEARANRCIRHVDLGDGAAQRNAKQRVGWRPHRVRGRAQRVRELRYRESAFEVVLVLEDGQ